LVPEIEDGKCGNTYYATHFGITPQTSDKDFGTACDEIIDICLVLSFLNARCVTPSGTTGQSEMQFAALGDDFIRARAICGFEQIDSPSLTSLFANWLSTTYAQYQQRRLRLQLSHWLSGLTCFSLEDIYLSAGVQMDIIKQRERAATGSFTLTYFQGMQSASSRYSISPLGNDYKNMRNDIVHEGVLSGSNFPSKSKAQCAAVIAETLNWLDQYIITVLGFGNQLSNIPRWKGLLLEHNLPAISVR